MVQTEIGGKIMFYTKVALGENAEIKVELDSENIYNLCPYCGEEVQVDLSELFSDGISDFYSTEVCCEKCSILRGIHNGKLI